MTAQADALNLPILLPARVEVQYFPPKRTFEEREAQPQLTWRQQRVVHARPQIQPIAGVSYGPDGIMNDHADKGRLLDAYV